ncbi:hypothetical protein Tco_1157139 [Tanacetum coccineum]
MLEIYPKCFRCNLTHHGTVSSRVSELSKNRSLEGRIVELGISRVHGNDFYAESDMFRGVVRKDISKDISVPKAGIQQNGGAHGRAYVVVENPQQNPNVFTEFRIDRFQTSIASWLLDSPYGLPLLNVEFSNQLKELQKKGFIQPSYLTMGSTRAPLSRRRLVQ